MRYRLLLAVIVLASLTVALANSQKAQPDATQPILTVMQRLMMDMHTVSLGIWTENYETVYAGAENIVNHPKILKKEREEIAGILGDRMKVFVAFDRMVHDHADSLAEAAKMRNMQDILHHYTIVQNGCVNCHSNFRTEILEGR